MEIKGSYKIDVIDDLSGEKIHSYTQKNKVFVDRFNDNMKLMKGLSNLYAHGVINNMNMNSNNTANTNYISLLQNLQMLVNISQQTVIGEYALFFTNDSMILHEQPDFVIDGNFRLFDLWQPTTVIDDGDVIGISHVDKYTPLFTKHDETKGKSIKFNINTPINKTSISCKTVSIPDLRQKRISYDVEYSYTYNSNVSEIKETEKIYSLGLVPSMEHFTTQYIYDDDNSNNTEINQAFSNNTFYQNKIFEFDYGVTKLQQLYNPNKETNVTLKNNAERENYLNSLVIDNLITYSELDIPQTVNYTNEDGTKSTKTFVITYKLQYFFDVPEPTDTYKETYLNSLYTQAFANERKQIELNQGSDEKTQHQFLPMLLSYHTYLQLYEYTKQIKDDYLQAIENKNHFLRKDRLIKVLDDFFSANIANEEFKKVVNTGGATNIIGVGYSNYSQIGNPIQYINDGNTSVSYDSITHPLSHSLFGVETKTSQIDFNNVCQNRFSFIPLYKFADVAEINDFLSKVTFNQFDKKNKFNVHYALFFTNKLAFTGICVYKGKTIPFIMYNHVHLNNIYLTNESWQFLFDNLIEEHRNYLTQHGFNTIINGYINIYNDPTYMDFYNYVFGANNLRLDIKFYENPIKIKNDDGEYLGMLKNVCDLVDFRLTMGL